MYSYTLLWQTREGSKCLSNRRETRRKIKQKHEWSLCERPVIKLLGTSLHQKRHTHTHSRTIARCIHTYTLTSSDYWAVAVTPLIKRVSVSEEKYNICRPRELLGRGKNKTNKKNTARDHPGNVNWWPVYHVTQPSHIQPPTMMLVLILKSTTHFQLYFRCTLWQCLLNVMCKK